MVMDKFEVFIKTILKMIFSESPFDEKKAKDSLQTIKKSYKTNGEKRNEQGI